MTSLYRLAQVIAEHSWPIFFRLDRCGTWERAYVPAGEVFETLVALVEIGGEFSFIGGEAVR